MFISRAVSVTLVVHSLPSPAEGTRGVRRVSGLRQDLGDCDGNLLHIDSRTVLATAWGP